MTTGKDRTKFLRLGGAGIEIALIIAFALACKTGDNARGRGENPDPPSPPYQEPVLKDYAGEEKKVLDGVHELNKLKQSIEMDVRSWRRARAPKSGPSFGGEADKLGDRILGKCDDLENNAKDLLRTDAVDAMTGTKRELRDLVTFASDTKETIRIASNE